MNTHFRTAETSRLNLADTVLERDCV